ncbi:integrase [Cupriavidus metallidurans]|uniref:tyrosine-type recombinase/integrase n=1 Tax=Cupriavidus metallidurans TaxID=119219 RepID=UPI0004934AB1|nr:hypothetical protein [Cupriavidus metallidurans]MDE4918386.1 hypothetical protein [Cupriavidus metallidurans]
MIGRRKRPDGLPFRLYARYGDRTTSFGYKLADGKWAFRLSAPTRDAEAVAAIKDDAIRRANELNGNVVRSGTTEALFESYFDWQESLPKDSELRKAQGTLDENRNEAKRLVAVFGKVRPAAIKPVHIYRYLADRAKKGAPAKANKEIALLSAVLEYGRRQGDLEENPCRGIKYNPTKPKDRVVTDAEIALMRDVARQRGGSYQIMALCAYTAFLTVSRPDEMRGLLRQRILPEGLQVPIGKRKAGQAQRWKLVHWSPELRAVIDEAMALQRTAGMYVFGNTSGQQYSRSGWTTIWTRLMTYCEAEAAKKEVAFRRFALADMRPSAVTDRMAGGDTKIIDATGHTDGKMVAKVYDRRRERKVKATR